jgi:hypothetical protein
MKYNINVTKSSWRRLRKPSRATLDAICSTSTPARTKSSLQKSKNRSGKEHFPKLRTESSLDVERHSMKSFGKTVLAMITAGIILWLGYHFLIEAPAARLRMDSLNRRQQLLKQGTKGGPGSRDARAELDRKEERHRTLRDR